MKVERKSISPPPIPHVTITPPSHPKKKPVTSPKVKFTGSGKPPVTFTPPAFSPPPAPPPVSTPPPPPVTTSYTTTSSTSGSGEFFDTFKNLFEDSYKNLRSGKKWPYIICAIILVITRGNILSHQVFLMVSLIIVLFGIPLIRVMFYLGKSRNQIVSTIVVVIFLLFAFSIPYNLIFNYHKSHVTVNKPAPVIQQQQSRLIYAKESIPLYASASSSGKLLGWIRSLEFITLTGNSYGSWRECLYNGQTGWIINNPSKYYTDPSLIRIQLNNEKSHVNLRNTPSTNGSVIQTIDKNAVMSFIDISSDRKWIRVRNSNGNYGWLWRKYIRPI
ncbi:MAG: SH3 domain-containing protein [Bacteroidetes bacterium]|nr:SH3 domain-containing protein [Bacteroidota bacterium]